ncbi:hypothetical protein BGZ76_005121 [Entomortierella beljakovae]|nr:hypothetical protein BGZ76_005121 [Entomortierella beljakovae]
MSGRHPATTSAQQQQYPSNKVSPSSLLWEPLQENYICHTDDTDGVLLIKRADNEQLRQPHQQQQKHIPSAQICNDIPRSPPERERTTINTQNKYIPSSRTIEPENSAQPYASFKSNPASTITATTGTNNRYIQQSRLVEEDTKAWSFIKTSFAVAETPYLVTKDICKAFIPVYSFFTIAAMIGITVGGIALWIARILISVVGADQEDVNTQVIAIPSRTSPYSMRHDSVAFQRTKLNPDMEYNSSPADEFFVNETEGEFSRLRPKRGSTSSLGNSRFRRNSSIGLRQNRQDYDDEDYEDYDDDDDDD